MVFFVRILSFFVIFLGLLGCESKSGYSISSDASIVDLGKRIASLEEDQRELEMDVEKVKKNYDDPDIKPELRANIRKELHEAEYFLKKIDQWISFLKIRRKFRYESLYKRRQLSNLRELAAKENEAYFVDKKFKPIKRIWRDRYKTAIEL